jgi:peptidoglycan L-alanyl-D-glutamate endopeptidase CwlK
MSEFKFGQASLNRLQSVDERLQKIANLALSISKVDFGIPSSGGFRTAEEQNRLYHGGKSQLDGYNRKSFHQTGRAIDVYAFVNGKASWEREHLAIVACAMLQAASTLGYELKWGGHWRNFVDMPHFELGD